MNGMYSTTKQHILKTFKHHNECDVMSLRELMNDDLDIMTGYTDTVYAIIGQRRQ